ncbi:hypothetical protein H2200_010804 [Cladophialophora chaetospira]|uniref:F-box domain-containing protein n=1 Tax=Cladophialophora chaetospira TaxID=386627 RepID=A0AA38X0V4_9EURO|nr:hypothetical protein H2200_010804 [Cladophialophora chaetospira]
MVSSVFRRTNSAFALDNGCSSGESSRRPSVADLHTTRRPSLATLSLRFSRSKRWNSLKETEADSESTHKLWEALLSLPDEITAQILCYLSLSDLFALRMSSRSVYTYLQYHVGPLTRSILLQSAYELTTDNEGCDNHEKARHLYNHIQTIYPPPKPCTSFDYLFQTLKRQSQVQRMLQALTNWLQMKVYVFPKFKRCDNFNPYKHKLMRRLHLGAWTLYHFLESFRTILVAEHPCHKARPAPRTEAGHSRCYWCIQAVQKLLRSYPGRETIPAYHFYELCRQHLHALSRAPSAGRLRARKSPPDSELMQFIALGGIPELCKLSLLKGSANQRIEVIANFVDKVSSAAIQQRIRGNVSSSSSQTGSLSPLEDLMAPLQTPFHLIHHSTISALPQLDDFVTGSEEWVTQMYFRVDPGDQIVSAWGFITNILTGKSDGSAWAEEKSGTDGADGDLDFLAPVKGFEE